MSGLTLLEHGAERGTVAEVEEHDRDDEEGRSDLEWALACHVGSVL